MSDTLTHLCPGGCGRLIANESLACPYHWRLVPLALQVRVYRTYRDRRARPHLDTVSAHQAAIRGAIRAIQEAASPQTTRKD
jgi:hypothetical protein